MKIRDDDHASFEPFSKRKDRKKPAGRRSVAALYTEQGTFSDPDLGALHERGYLDAVLGELKSGKEATVYLAEGASGLLAAKLYRDARVRSFKSDGVYRQGRYVGDPRIEKAIAQRSRSGLAAQQALWVFQEYLELWALYRAGIPVPEPKVGPDLEAIGMAGKVVLMAFVGDADGPAPRLSDIRLGAEAEAAWEQSVDILARLLALGKVHGDYSTYNLLWWQGQVVVIDFPQIINVAENPQWGVLLERDAESLCTSFRRHGLRGDAGALVREVRVRAARYSGK